jgi:hypothetical protein
MVEDTGSPTVLLSGDGSENFIHLAASLCARYSDAKNLPEVEVTVMRGADRFRVAVSPAAREVVEHYRIERRDQVETSRP